MHFPIHNSSKGFENVPPNQENSRQELGAHKYVYGQWDGSYISCINTDSSSSQKAGSEHSLLLTCQECAVCGAESEHKEGALVTFFFSRMSYDFC